MTASGSLRVLLGLAAGASLVAGFSGGLVRLDIVLALETAADHHGVLMVCGFFGTLISLERAVAAGGKTAIAVPALAAAGSALLLSGAPTLAAAAFLLSGVGLLALTAYTAWKLPTPFTAVMTVGAALWPIGTTSWLAGWTVPELAYVWLGFLILTIAAERIELSRLAKPGLVAQLSLIVVIGGLIAALALGQPWTGSWLLAASLASLSLWLLVNDVAIRTVRTRGFARFSASCLLLGYGWLLVAAGLLVAAPPASAAFGHDAAVHAIAIGFVLSMVFAHAPIILPAVAGARVHYTAALYVPVAVLQAAVAARVLGGTAAAAEFVIAGAWLTVAAFAVYAVTLASTSLRMAPSEPLRRLGKRSDRS